MSEINADPAAKRVTNRWPYISGGIALALGVVLAFLIAQRGNTLPFELDSEWSEEVFEDRLPFLEWLSYGMNWIGGGIFGTYILPILIVIALLLIKRPWASLFFAVASLVSVGVAQLLKSLVGRARPEEMLVTSDFGSFPSGHVANAATMAVALGIIFPRVWVWAAGTIWVALMMFSRTYLGVHWLTDTIGGALLGAGVVLILWAPFASRISGEPRDKKSAAVPDRKESVL
ncbi:phosphatase PAP2 family protein [Mycetocola zhujimingii]|uniref:PAP2 family protein n=1 Tax=Mycetocola zhujimingii TaxID=2079792 RepID=A0A2U1TFJ4_9MICO|nr:phosphatase PAP2 family protein [Mycetocola zhujimingii]AWB85602.1 phosphoesterase PA-phosphatase [Mycetocola zhujimingii]PWC07651.1 PAP2 family protein [Mycetocola zhujimingii]